MYITYKILFISINLIDRIFEECYNNKEVKVYHLYIIYN